MILISVEVVEAMDMVEVRMEDNTEMLQMTFLLTNLASFGRREDTRS